MKFILFYVLSIFLFVPPANADDIGLTVELSGDRVVKIRTDYWTGYTGKDCRGFSIYLHCIVEYGYQGNCRGGYCSINAWDLALNRPVSNANMAAAWMSRSSSFREFALGGHLNEDTCFYVLYRNATVGIATALAKPISGTTCVKPKPPVAQCEIASGDIVLDHGTLNNSDVNGNKVSKDVVIYCSRNTTVRVYAQNVVNDTEIINLNREGTLNARLSVNGRSGAVGDVIGVQGNTGSRASISSELFSTSKVDVGNFSGGGVVYVEII